MNIKILDRFKDYVRHNYNNCDLTNPVICSDIHCSISYLYDILNFEYYYSCMQYVRYFRVLKSMEFIICNQTKKVYRNVGYKSSSAFYRNFLKVTGFDARCFYADELKEYFEEYKGIFPVIYGIAAKDPKEAIEFIIDNSSIRSILLDKQSTKQKRKKL